MDKNRKVFDCILYHGEVDILRLRLALMAPHVHRFIILEGNTDFSGAPRSLQFPSQKGEFREYLEKIDHHPVDLSQPFQNAWDREHFLRDQVRILCPAEEEDLIIVADTDEIIHLPVVMEKYRPGDISVVELSTHYGFLNLRSSEKIRVTLLAPFGKVKDLFLGNRNMYADYKPSLIRDMDGDNGGHFTYQFGFDIPRYIEKIRAFSHVEFATDHFMDGRRLKKCLLYHLDILERYQFSYELVEPTQLFFDPTRAKSGQSLPWKTRTIANQLRYFLRFADPYYWKVTKIPRRIWLSGRKKKLLSLFKTKET